ncbi:MAG: hypothetical protein ACYTFQ_23700 [Planctomycetota bacterium]|jgi:hypothetical protein
MKLSKPDGIIVPDRIQEGPPTRKEVKWSDRFNKGEYFVLKGVILQATEIGDKRMILKPLLLNPGQEAIVEVKGAKREPPKIIRG